MHVSSKIWEIRQQNSNNQSKIDEISERFNISPITANIILNRGIEDLDEIDKFLNPNSKNFHDPFLLKDMDKAVQRIVEAIKQKQKVVIFGDYDVDGITSTSILLQFLNEYTQNSDFYIPDRVEEGYGLNINSIDKVISSGANLIITVDCGITAVQEIEYIKSKGVDIIITDHHECKEEIPKAHAVINPKQEDCKYPFKDLAGVGVVFKLLQGLQKAMNSEDVIEKYIDIVALGTVADVVPLLGENRIIVKYGLEKIKNTENFGIKSLINIAGLQSKQITTTTIGYTLAPRINAAGRIGDASKGVELFLAQDKNTAHEIALQLDKNNKDRQQTENGILMQALEMIENNKEISEQKIIVLASENWHHGVIGIVASRITEKFNKPSILISLDEEVGKGSGRSIPNFNIFEALMKCSDKLQKFGGHELAVGLSIAEKNVSEFRKQINEYADAILTEADFYPRVKIDGKIEKNDLNFTLLNEFKKLEPHGIANRSPLFIYSNLKIVDCKTVGDNKHLKLRMEDEGFYVDSIGFNLGEISPKIDIFDKVDVVCSLEINKWNGQEKLQLNIKDLRTNFDIIFKERYYSTLENAIFNNLDINDLSEKILKNVKIYNDSIFSIIKNNEKNLILINTLKGAKHLIELLKNSEQKYKELVSVNYNFNKSKENLKNIVIINPYLNEIEISKFDNIIMYDLCFSKNQYNYLIKSSKNIYIMNDFRNYSNNLDVFEGIIPQRDELIKVYQYIKSRNYNDIFEGNIYSITREIAISYNIDINSYKIRKIFEIFHEMNLINIETQDEYYKITIKPQMNQKINIMDSKGLSKLIKVKDEFKYFIDYLKQKQIC